MSAQVDQATVSEAADHVQIPRPLEGGSYDVESLGPFIDRLMGDRRVRQRAAEAIRVLTAESEPDEEPPEAPVEIPPPVPGGGEPVRRGNDPPAETR